MHPILFHMGIINIYSYGFMLAIGFLVGGFLTINLAKKEGISEEKVLDVLIYTIIAAIVGARLAYVMFFYWEFLDDPISVFFIQDGGLAFYGGLFLAILAVLWRANIHKIPILKILDIGSAPVLLGYSITRIGCFLNGCCYGAETSLPWGVCFPNLDGPRHPTQLYGSLIVFIFFLIVLNIWKKRKFEGQAFLTALSLYMVYRFFIDFIRVGGKIFYGFTSVQIISVFVLIASLYSLFLGFRKS